jgi:uncharacterized membrane protein
MKLSRYYAVLALSVLLSILAVTATLYYSPIISVDSSLYLLTSQVYASQGFKAMLTGVNWPFYPLLIHYTHVITGLSSLHSAYLQNYLYFIVSVLAFLGIVRRLGGELRHVIWALFAIMSFRYFIKINAGTIRDTGYLCFYLLSLYHFIRFAGKQTWCRGVVWIVCMVIATLYRIEGVVILALSPFAALFFEAKSVRARFLAWFKLVWPGFVLFLFLIIASCLSHAFFLLASDKFMDSVVPMYGNQAVQNFQNAVHTIATQSVVDTSFAGAAPWVLVFGLIGAYIAYLVMTLGVGKTLAVIYLKRAGAQFHHNQKWALGFYIVPYLLFTLFYVFMLRFLDSRYLLGLSLALLTLVPFSLVKMFTRWKTLPKWHFKNGLFPLVMLFMCLSILSTFCHIGPSKRYMLRAAKWLNTHTQKEAVIVTQGTKLAYYVDRSVVGWRCHVAQIGGVFQQSPCFTLNSATNLPSSYQYIVYDVKNKKALAAIDMKMHNQKPIKVFKSNRSREMLIYQHDA